MEEGGGGGVFFTGISLPCLVIWARPRLEVNVPVDWALNTNANLTQVCPYMCLIVWFFRQIRLVVKSETKPFFFLSILGLLDVIGCLGSTPKTCMTMWRLIPSLGLPPSLFRRLGHLDSVRVERLNTAHRLSGIKEFIILVYNPFHISSASLVLFLCEDHFHNLHLNHIDISPELISA